MMPLFAFFVSKAYAAEIDWPDTVDTFGELIGNILKIIYPLAGIALFLLILYGGFTWLTSAGDPEKVRKGIDTIVNAVIGIVIIVFAYVATKVVGGILGVSLI